MKQRRAHLLAAAFFSVCAIMTAFYLIAGYGAYLDADMASELVLARQLVRERSLVSSQWYYSTEVRILNTQLVFTPLMALFGGSWRAVRTLGCLALLAILAGASLYAARRMGAKWPYALVFAGLNISVCSPIYAQNVIIGAYYIPHAVLTMLVLGLYAGALRGGRGSRARAAALLCLAFILGLSSVRYLLAALIPLACAGIWQAVFVREREEMPRTAEQMIPAGVAVWAALMGGAGLVVFEKVLVKAVHCQFGYTGTAYADWNAHDLFEQMQTVIGGLLTALGFEGGVPLFGAQGVINALILLTLIVCGMMLWRTLKGLRGDARGGIPRMGALMFAFAFSLSFAMFVLLRSVYFDRYWLPVIMLGAPVMAMCFSRERNWALRRLALTLMAGTVLLSSASCIYYSLRHPQAEREMRMVAVEAIRERGLDKGYATFWNANIVTELSNGEIEVAALEKKEGGADGEQTLAPLRWLETDESLAMDRPEQPVFLLLGTWEKEGLDGFLERAQAVCIELEGWIDLYVIPEQRLLFEAMEGS